MNLEQHGYGIRRGYYNRAGGGGGGGVELKVVEEWSKGK